MPDKDPSSYSLLTYLWVFALAMMGGVVNFFRKIKSGQSSMFNLIEFIGEVVTSAFAGVITFWICEHADIAPLVTAALVGISGHAGSRAIYFIEDVLRARFPDGSGR